MKSVCACHRLRSNAGAFGSFTPVFLVAPSEHDPIQSAVLPRRDYADLKLTQTGAGHMFLRKEQIKIANWDHTNEER